MKVGGPLNPYPPRWVSPAFAQSLSFTRAGRGWGSPFLSALVPLNKEGPNVEEKQDVKAYRPWKGKPIICTDCATDEERQSEDFEPLKMRN